MTPVFRHTATLAHVLVPAVVFAACATVDNDIDVVSDASRDTGDTSLADAGTDTGLDITFDSTPDAAADVGLDAVPDATADADTAADELKLIGTWDTDWGGFVRITEAGVGFTWLGDDIVAITRFDNAGSWFVGQNTEADEWNPGLWSRFDWVDTGDGVLWCQTAFAAESEQAAVDTPAADATARETGCGGFAWTVLTPGQGPFALNGTWDDDFGGVHTIEGGTWIQTYAEPEPAPLQFRIDAFDNAAQFAVAQNDEGNEWAGGQWSRFDWTVVGEEVWYCQTIWDAASSDEAAATPPADGADPAMSGCGGAPWSRLVPVVEE